MSRLLDRITLAIMVVISQTTYAQVAPQKSILEIKAMQTRVFERGQNELIEGITEYWTNKNGTCSDGNGLNKPYYLPINLQQVMPNFRSKNPADREIRVSYEKLEGHQGKLVCRMPGDGRPGSRFRWEYEINLPTIPFDGKLIPIANQQSLYGIQAKRVTVRARLYVNDEKRLSLDDEAYPLHFKRLADAMFVNAIELTPQEMQ
jgi:hypothetical protein